MKAKQRSLALIGPLIAAALIPSAEAVAQSPKGDPAPPRAGVLSREDDRAVRKVMAGMDDAWNAHDMKALAALFREDAEFVNVVGMHWRGRDEIMAAHTAFHDTIFKSTKVKCDALETRSIADHVAIVVATSTMDSFTTPDGHVRPKAQNRLTCVLVKTSDGWKVVQASNVTIDADAAQNDPAKAPRG